MPLRLHVSALVGDVGQCSDKGVTMEIGQHNTNWWEAKGKPTLLSNERRDLIKRLFAVAISIGFGAALVKASWVSQGTMPTASDFPQITIIAVALAATIFSWDGYHQSIETKPLNGIARFAIDVLLVFCYMFIFITSANNTFWLPILCFMFFLYSIWDFLSVAEYSNQFKSGGSSPLSTILSVYTKGFLRDREVNPGPVITLMWGFAFYGIYYLYQRGANHFITCFVVIVALYLYRADKGRRVDGLRGFGFLLRCCAMALLLLVVFASKYFTERTG